MEFRKMVMVTLYAKQKKRHRCTEQTFGLCGRRRGWDVSREQHQNIYIIKGETDDQPRLDAWDKCSDLVHWEDPERSGGERGGRGGSGWGLHVNPWLNHVNVWQKPLQYCKIISLQLKKQKPNKSNNNNNNKSVFWDLPGSPVVKTLCFQSRGMGLIPGQGTKVPNAVWCGHKVKIKKKKIYIL